MRVEFRALRPSPPLTAYLSHDHRLLTMTALSPPAPRPASPGFVDGQFWDRLRNRDPEEVCRGALVSYDPKRRGFLVPFFNEEHLVLPAERLIERTGTTPADGKPPSFYVYFAAVHYLLTAKARPLAGEMAGPKELRDGELFFSGGSHAPNLAPLLQRFDGRAEAFGQAAEAIGGYRVAYGDAAVEVRALPRVPVTLVLWFGDEEFAGRGSVLFDKSVQDQLPIEGLLPVISEAVKRLTRI